MNLRILASITLLSAFLIFGCSGSNTTVKKASTSSLSTIAHTEIYDAMQLHTLDNAYEVVRHLRPNLLRVGFSNRMAHNGNHPKVYLDNKYFGEFESLNYINSRFITEITYLKHREAHTRFGYGHDAGVFLVSTK